MEASTLNQIIESGTFLLLGFLGFFIYRIRLQKKKWVEREEKLLKDCLFYRAVIEEYKEELEMRTGEGTMYHSLRKKVREELGYQNSEISNPGEISQRLQKLKKLDRMISDYLDKIKL